MGVDGGGDADVGVAEEFLDHDEFDALFQEQRGGRVPETVKADAAGEVGGVMKFENAVASVEGAEVFPRLRDAWRWPPMSRFVFSLAVDPGRQFEVEIIYGVHLVTELVAAVLGFAREPHLSGESKGAKPFAIARGFTVDS